MTEYYCLQIFIYCAYFTIVDRIVESKIEYDPISGYECRNLAPRNSAITLSSSNSEEVDFSSSRFLLNECLNNLSSTGTFYLYLNIFECI